MGGHGVRIVGDVARRVAAMIDREVREMLGPDATFEEEQDAAAAVTSDALWLRADNRLHEKVTTADEVEMEGRRYHRLEQDSSATYHCPWGSHRIEEALYREVGVHNGPTIKPIELRVGIIEHMTPDMARIVGELSADRSSRGVERTLRATRLVPPSRAFLAKHTTEMGIEIADQVGELEQVAREAEEVPGDVASVSSGLDRMSVRMGEPADLDTACAPSRTEPYERTPPPPKEHRSGGTGESRRRRRGMDRKGASRGPGSLRTGRGTRARSAARGACADLAENHHGDPAGRLRAPDGVPGEHRRRLRARGRSARLEGLVSQLAVAR